MPISDYYENKKIEVTYGGKEYDICFLRCDPDDDDYMILMNDDIDGSIGTCELEFPASTWYTSIETAPDGKKYRVGNEAATVENLKLYPIIFWGSTSGDSRANYWRKGKKIYSERSQTGSYNFNAKINTFCIRVTGRVTNALTGATHNITLDDLLNPDEESYISYMDNENGYLLNYSTNKFDANLRSIRPGALISGNTIGGVVDFRNLSSNNASKSYFLSDGSEASSGGGYTIIKDLDSKAMVTPLLKDLNVDYPNKTYTFSEPWYIESSFTDTRQTIRFDLSLKFYVKILQSLGCYITVESLGTSLTFNEDFLKNNSKVILGELDAKGHPTFNWITSEEREESTSPNLNPNWIISDNTYGPIAPQPSRLDQFVYGGNDIINSSVRLHLAKKSDLGTIYSLILDQAPIGFDFTKNIISLMGIVGKDFFIDTYEGTFNDLIFTATGYETPGIATQFIKNENILVEGYTKILSTQKDIIYVGEVNVPRLNNSFLDYEPYSEIELFIPLCGWYKLPSIVVGKKIKINFLIDLANCTIKALVDCDGVTIVEGSGNFGIPMQMTNINVGVMDAARLQANVATVSSLALGAVGALTGNVALAAGGLTGLANSFTQEVITSNKNFVFTKGKSGDKTDFGNGEYCYLKITHPKPDIPEDYGKFIGYICNKKMNLSDCHGFTIISDARLETLGTEEEKDELKKLLERGVIFP